MAIDANSRARSFLRSGSSVQKNDIGLNVFNEFRVRVYKEKTIKKNDRDKLSFVANASQILICAILIH